MIQAKLLNPDYSSRTLVRVASRILAHARLFSVATVNPNQSPHIHTAFFCRDDLFTFYFVSDWRTKHCRNLAARPGVAAAVYDSRQDWIGPLRGLQLFGRASRCSATESVKARKLYSARFPAYARYLESLTTDEIADSPHKFFRIQIVALKLFDDEVLGDETFVPAEVVRP